MPPSPSLVTAHLGRISDCEFNHSSCVGMCWRTLGFKALFVSVYGTALDGAHQSQMGLLSLYSNAGLARRLGQWVLKSREGKK